MKHRAKDLASSRAKLFNSIAVSALSLHLYAAVEATRAQAAEVSFADFPVVIFCSYADIDHAFYLSKVGADDVAIYISPDRHAGMITIHGTAERIGGDQPGNCAGKTLEQLRSAGQAFDLRR